MKSYIVEVKYTYRVKVEAEDQATAEEAAAEIVSFKLTSPVDNLMLQVTNDLAQEAESAEASLHTVDSYTISEN
jgi:hypothetical protein